MDDSQMKVSEHNIDMDMVYKLTRTATGSPNKAWDCVTGLPLDPNQVDIARQAELTYIDKMQVWEVIPRETAIKEGWKIIQTRWIDINKGDDKRPNYRSRNVAREIAFYHKKVDSLPFPLSK